MYSKPRVFRKTVGTSGVRERLTTSDLKVPAITIQALPENTNNVYIGDDQVTTSNGLELDALDSITLSAQELGLGGASISLRDIWLDVDTGAEGVQVLYLERVK